MCLLLVEFVGWKGSRDGLLTEIAGLVRSGWRWCAWYFWRWWGCHRGEKRPADWQWNSHFSSYAQHTSTTEPNSETSKATCVCWVYPRVSLSHYCYWYLRYHWHRGSLIYFMMQVLISLYPTHAMEILLSHLFYIWNTWWFLFCRVECMKISVRVAICICTHKQYHIHKADSYVRVTRPMNVTIQTQWFDTLGMKELELSALLRVSWEVIFFERTC